MNGFVLILLVSLFSLVADVVLKKAADLNNNYFLVLGCILYVIDAILWYFAFKLSKFSTVGITYSLIVIMISVLIGILYFREKILPQEILGIFFGILAIIFLSRFK